MASAAASVPAAQAEAPSRRAIPYLARVNINNERKRNALSYDVLADLEAQLKAVNPGWEYRDGWLDLDDIEGSLRGVNRKCKVVVLESAGPVFSSGHDLKEMATQDRALVEKVFAKCQDVMLLLRRLPQPVIARVQGLTTAAGTQLVAQSDLAIASDRATFATPGVQIGLFCTTPSIPLARPLSVPSKHSLHMLFTGEPLTAHEAWQQGLVSKVVPHDELDAAIDDTCTTIGTRSFATLVIGKHAFWKHADMAKLEDAYAYASRVMVENMMLSSAKDGVDGFLRKEKVVWE
ncbi:enoyl-CoA hydratase [Hyaloraphidium curvatum]|nr:enoyl-CoA hydratase [Hyaloraphidium curvatum]